MLEDSCGVRGCQGQRENWETDGAAGESIVQCHFRVRRTKLQLEDDQQCVAPAQRGKGRTETEAEGSDD